jgi:hypothetical protein
VWLSPAEVAQIDALRGETPRSEWMRARLLASLSADASSTAPEAGPVLWIHEHPGPIVHRSSHPEGFATVCGMTVSGSPIVSRDPAPLWSTPSMTCPRCEALFRA